jgi:hypothetical protein
LGEIQVENAQKQERKKQCFRRFVISICFIAVLAVSLHEELKNIMKKHFKTDLI